MVDAAAPQTLKGLRVVAEISTGAVFLSMHRGDTVGAARLTAQSVALIVKAFAAKAALEASRYAGHSLRSGVCGAIVEKPTGIQAHALRVANAAEETCDTRLIQHDQALFS